MGQSDREQLGPLLEIAVVGSGISGLSAAWLLSQRHHVTLFEADGRLGGHSHTVDLEVAGRRIAVDTGFIVYNEPCYPNLTALFAHLELPTAATDMSFSVSFDGGAFEYAGNNIRGLFAQRSNILKPRFWLMLASVLRFYRQAPCDLATMGEQSLDEYLDRQGFSRAFREDHLYPMAAAIWSTPALDVGGHPAAAFIRFCDNHGLLQLTGRPQWRTIPGGSREYVARLVKPFAKGVRTGTAIHSVRREGGRVVLTDKLGRTHRFAHAVLAVHADRALALLADPSPEERNLLGAFNYSANEAVLHTDPGLMPQRRPAWSSWNYLSAGSDGNRRLSVTYWMNRLQPLGDAPPVFVTLNPLREPRSGTIVRRDVYEHPVFTTATARAQAELWRLQGQRNTWYCGAYFGAGFHEDGLQSGLAVAEDLGGCRRPWDVPNDSGRIARHPMATPSQLKASA